MGVLTDEVQAAIRAERLAYVATVNADGTPNLAPKATTTVLDGDHLVFADIASPRTVANLRERPRAEVNVVDPIRRKGWRLSGEGRVVDGGEELAGLLTFFRERGVEIERHGSPRVRRAVVIHISRASELVSPGYDAGATENEVAQPWTRFWRERSARFDPAPLAGHEAWMSFPAPSGIVLAREDGQLPVEEFIRVVSASGLNRPVGDLRRMTSMLANSNLIVTARDSGEGGRLIGVSRCVTDFAFCCYLSDLCVDVVWQGRGVGRTLVAETKRAVGPECNVVLLSAPRPMTYYPRIGMERVDNAFIIRRDR
jgi:Pyridoxamine 5'-phosphate oxidase/Acetyltransferase (GNAT) domain